MRALRFVRLSEDAATLVVQAAEDGEHFALGIDPLLRDAVTAAAGRGLSGPGALTPARDEPAHQPVAAAPAEPPAPAAPIVPREIQIRVRAGESPEEVAESLGTDLARVLRFAAPVVDERRRIADEARRARARHTAPEGTDGKPVIFGEAVDARFTAHGIPAADVSWDSYRREDGEWVVVARWTGGAGDHDARWVFHRTSRSVTPVDDTAADLLSDRPIRPMMPPAPPRLVVAPPLVPGVVAFPPMPDAHTGPIAVVEEVFDQEAEHGVAHGAAHGVEHGIEHRAERARTLRPAPLLDRTPASAATVPLQPVADPAPAPDPIPPADLSFDLSFDRDAPPLPLGIAEPVAPAPTRGAKRDASDEERAARARIPSWDDILLGVRRKTD